MKCPGCGIERSGKAGKCSICGYEQEEEKRPEPPLKPVANAESTIWQGNPSALYYIPQYLLGLLLLPFFGVGLLVIIYAILARKSMSYALTTKKVSAQAGIASRRSCDVDLRDIRSINTSQTLIERLFGLGSVFIGSAGTGDIEIAFRGIPNPVGVKNQISQSANSLR